MPRLSQYFVRSALLCLALSLTVGGFILAAKGGAVTPIVWEWLPAHIALALNGWLIQLALGVAYWIFPRILGANRGRPQWAWASFSVFQVGTVLVIISLLQPWWAAAYQLLAVGVILHAISIGLFAVHAFPRVRGAFVRAANPSNNSPE